MGVSRDRSNFMGRLSGEKRRETDSNGTAALPRISAIVLLDLVCD